MFFYFSKPSAPKFFLALAGEVSVSFPTLLSVNSHHFKKKKLTADKKMTIRHASFHFADSGFGFGATDLDSGNT